MSERPTEATRLVKLAESHVELLFHCEQRAYARMAVNGHFETASLRSYGFRTWLTQLGYVEHGRVPTTQAVQDAMRVLEGRAIFEGNEEPVSVRVAGRTGVIYFDLGSPTWEAVEITRDGWSIVRQPPVQFIRPRGMLAVARPAPGGQIEGLRPFVNLRSDDEWRLFVSWLVAALRPQGPFPVLQVGGESGSAKSTLQRIVKKLIDPTKAPLRAEPKDVRDLMIAAQNCWVLSFDNLSSLSRWLSDGMCRLSTGGGFATRELYSDSEETQIDLMRPIVAGGIPDLANADDLVDRLVGLTLRRIDETVRQPEELFWPAFEAAQPQILGALFAGVACALREVEGVRLARAPRMADYARWATAASPAFGWEPGAFMRSYDGNTMESALISLESSLLAECVLELIRGDGAWYGRPGKLLERLTEIAGDRARDRAHKWPKSPAGLGKAVRRLAPSLRKTGVVVDDGREPGGDRPRFISLSRSG